MTRILTTTEAAAQLGVARGSLNYWVWAGQCPPPVRLGNVFMWTSRDVERARQALAARPDGRRLRGAMA